MRRRVSTWVWLLIIGLLLFPMAALAGGWAVITLDSLPAAVRAGQSLSLGFMVRQHGVTPIDTVFGDAPLIPRLIARHVETGESLSIDGRKEGPLGHFVVDVTFPSAGTWEWEIIPEPFGGTQLGQLTVLPPPASAPQSAAAPQPAAQPVVAQVESRSTLRLAGALMLLVAVAVAVASRRAPSVLRRPSTT